jgi:hypothetical protein
MAPTILPILLRSLVALIEVDNEAAYTNTKSTWGDEPQADVRSVHTVGPLLR